MDIKDLTIGDARKFVKVLGSISGVDTDASDSPLQVGKTVFIRRAGEYHYLGEVIEFTNEEIILSDASWVADSMRLYDFFQGGLETPGIEIEPFVGDNVTVSVPRAKSEVSLWPHKLPSAQIG